MLISEPNENRQERRATPEFLTEEPVFEMNLNQQTEKTEDRKFTYTEPRQFNICYLPGRGSRNTPRQKAQERKSQKPDREETDKMPTQANQNHTEPYDVILG